MELPQVTRDAFRTAVWVGAFAVSASFAASTAIAASAVAASTASAAVAAPPSAASAVSASIASAVPAASEALPAPGSTVPLGPVPVPLPVPVYRAAPVGYGWGEFFGIDLTSLGSRRSLLVLGVAGAGSAWSWQSFDDRHDSVQESLDGSFLDPVMDFGNRYGSGWVIGGGGLAVLAAGGATGQDRLVDLGGDLCRSFAYSAGMTGALKYGFDRRRPSGGAYSFPSGHTTSAFSAVPPIWHHLGWQPGVAAAALAGFTGAGRMEEDRHYLSDVIFGAAVGLVVGRAVVARRKRSDWVDRLVISDEGVAWAWAF